ncbi:hypothetical protein OG455_02150 [Kitasatospora sp. NBC_01287]|uniref:hypothetical protein n=1 Tax=Kitasatospora sp. NBC_01287 TaxID=2903573 RepID=UPI00224ECFAA|nr:hypothetical protein [Kitasatospora sp. NBC_01287]MCX4744327.1 hypothetical protein [Kitasatospora sp. NBC_01287]
MTRDRTGTRISQVALWLALWWLWMPLGALLVWLVKHEVFGGFGQQDQSYVLFLRAEFFPHGWPLGAAPLFWVWVFIGLVGSLIIIPLVDEGAFGSWDVMSWPRRVVMVGLVLATLLSAVRTGTGLWDNDKEVGRFYAAATVLDVPGGGRAPASVLPVTDHAKPGGGGRCDLVGTGDVPSCVKTAPMPDFDFDPRTASYGAATTALSAGSGLASRVRLMQHSVHYLPGAQPGKGVWTAVLDGSGLQPTEGVALWDGSSNTVSSCEFQGDHAFDRAFGGDGANSLRNLLAQRFPALVYDDQDIWGYCDGSDPSTAAPVIVISVERQVAFADRTVLQPAGVLVLKGSPSGRPVIDYRAVVHPGELPGAAYPASVVRDQIHEVQWLAGRGAKDDSSFGYSHTSADTNAGNPGEFLLRSDTDGHFYYVTPLVPRDSSSQAIVAFAVVQADQVGNGLNELHVYVRADSDPAVNLSGLTSRMVSWISQQTSVTVTSGTGGELQEIIPFGHDMWRGFVDIDGQTQDYVDLSADASVTPNLVFLKGSIPAPGGAQPPASPSPSPASPGAAPPGSPAPGPAPSGSVDCGGDPAELTPGQLSACISAFAGELQRRAH